MAAIKERATELLGPIDEALEVAREGVLGSARCTYESAGALDGDDVAADKLQDMLAEFGGDSKVSGRSLVALCALFLICGEICGKISCRFTIFFVACFQCATCI